MRQSDSKKVFLIPKITEKLGTAAAVKNITMWYNHKTIRYTYEPSDKGIIFNFELPGKAKQDVKVFRKNNSLNIKVKNKDTFNGNIGSWNVSKVTNMNQMFNQAQNFNQNIGSWNVSSVENMSQMFKNATSFNQDLSSWNISGLPEIGANSWNTISGDVFAGSGMASYVDNSNLWPRLS